MMTILTFLVALGILVVVHEWGHYIVAKLSGIWVEKFSIGFGPKILGFHKNGTDYRVAPIPLGGYVKLYGQDPLEEAEGDEAKALEIANDPRSFHSKPLPKKLATVFAGPIMNFVLCLLIMPLVFMLGRMQPKILDEKPVVIGIEDNSPAAKIGLQKGDEILSLAGATTKNWQELMMQIALHPNQNVNLKYERAGQVQETSVSLEQDKAAQQITGYMGIEPLAYIANEPVIDTVQPDSPASQAGFQPGDEIIEINAQPVQYWTTMNDAVQNSDGKALSMTVRRGETTQTLSVTPAFNDAEKRWLIGITKKIDMSAFEKKRFGFVDSVVMGTQQNIKLFGLTIDVLKRLFTGDLSYKTLGGPIQIAKATSAAAQSGLAEFIYLLSFLSLQLGIMNLLPVPVLDGGHIVMMLVESARRKPFTPKVRQVSMQIGMVMLLGLMVVVTINDLNSLPMVQNLIHSVKGLF